MMACGRRSPVPWEDAFYSELPKPTRIGHSIGHQVQQLLPDGNSQLTILGIIAKGIIRAAALPRWGSTVVELQWRGRSRQRLPIRKRLACPSWRCPKLHNKRM